MEAFAQKRVEDETTNDTVHPERTSGGRKRTCENIGSYEQMTTYLDTTEKQTNGGGSTRWPPYHWLVSPDIAPIASNFWRVNYDEKDMAMYNRFLEILRLSERGLNGEEIGRTLHMNNVRAFLTGRKKSFLTHIRAELDRLGIPHLGYSWLPMQLKPRGTPADKWIQVPAKINKLEDITKVICQSQIPENAISSMKEFGYSTREELAQDRTTHFGFLVGASIGAMSGLTSQ